MKHLLYRALGAGAARTAVVMAVAVSTVQIDSFAAGRATLRALFVGNSYTYADDIPWLTKHLAASGKPPKALEVEMVAPMGATLKNHWETGTVLRRLHEQKWDFVVLQEQSMVPIQSPGTTYKYVRLFERGSQEGRC